MHIYRLQKNIFRAFKILGLRIALSSNLKIVHIFDFNNNSWKLFIKNNDIPTYINVNYKPPRSIIR